MAKAIKPLQHALVLAAAIFTAFLVSDVSPLANGLKTAPFVLLTTVVALLGDFGPGIFAIAVGAVGVEYAASPAGWAFDTNTIFKVLEFLVIGITIFLLAWRSRRLYASNIVLKQMTDRLQDITRSLKTEAAGNEKQLKKLNDVNRDLVQLVDQFIADDDYWKNQLPVAAPATHRSSAVRRQPR